jgi:aconitate hydratase
MVSKNSFGAASVLRVNHTDYQIFRLDALEKAFPGVKVSRIPYSVRVLLENLLRFEDARTVKASDIEYVAKWDTNGSAQEVQFRPARILLQDFTGVPCVVDLAAMRDALKKLGANPELANPLIPADLVIDHSVQVDAFGTPHSAAIRSVMPSCVGGKEPSPIFALSRRIPALFTKSTSNTWPTWSSVKKSPVGSMLIRTA